MKLKGLFAIMAAALMLSMSFTSCEELDGLFDDENESTDNQAFFPNTYRQRTVAAWYSLTEKEESGTRIEAVFLFDDNSFVTTKSKTYTDGRSQERKILAEGDYTLTGDYENGTAEVKINGAPDPMTVTIENGKMLAMGETFTKQNNKKVPKPSEESEGGEGGGGQGGQGGDDDGIEAFFPTGYSSKNVSAWFSQKGVMSEQGYEIKYNASIYFLDDQTFVATAYTLVEGPQGLIPTKTISLTGQYSILKGDFTDGDIELKGSDGKVVTVEIRDGKLKYIEVDGSIGIYIKQDNSKVPQPSDPDNNGQQGGQGDGDGDGDGEGQGDEVPAFFPNQFAQLKVVAWYSFKEGEPAETRVDAVFLLDGGIVVITENKVFGESTGMNPERYILDYGKYELTAGSDYENGSATVILERLGEKRVTINNGILKVEGLYGDYTKRDNADVPKPLDPTDQGQQGGDGDGDDDGDGDGDGDGEEFDQSLMKAYLPSDYPISAIAAWYYFIEEEKNESDGKVNGVRIEAVYLFTENKVLVTKTKLYSKSDGRAPEYKVTATGQYSFTEGGDFENGIASVVLADGSSFKVVIEDGVMTAKDTEFTMLPNDLLKTMTTSGK